MKKVVPVVSAILVIIGIALWLQPWAQPSMPVVGPLYSGEVIAKVAGEPIFLEQGAFRAQGIQTAHQVSQLGKQNVSPWPQLIVQSLADDVIIRHEMAKLGIGISNVALASAMTHYINGFGGPGGYKSYLASEGLTDPQFQNRVYMNLLGGAAYLDITKDVTVPESAIKAAFLKSPEQFPGANRELAYAQGHDSIEQYLLKQKKDAAFSSWLVQQEAKPEYKIQVLNENWWRQLTTETQNATQGQGQ